MSDQQTTDHAPDPFAGEQSDADWLRADARERRRRGLVREAERLERLADEIHGKRERQRRVA